MVGVVFVVVVNVLSNIGSQPRHKPFPTEKQK